MEHTNKPMDNLSEKSLSICGSYIDEITRSHQYANERSNRKRSDLPKPVSMEDYARLLYDFLSLSGKH